MTKQDKWEIKHEASEAALATLAQDMASKLGVEVSQVVFYFNEQEWRFAGILSEPLPTPDACASTSFYVACDHTQCFEVELPRCVCDTVLCVNQDGEYGGLAQAPAGRLG